MIVYCETGEVEVLMEEEYSRIKITPTAVIGMYPYLVGDQGLLRPPHEMIKITPAEFERLSKELEEEYEQEGEPE